MVIIAIGTSIELDFVVILIQSPLLHKEIAAAVEVVSLLVLTLMLETCMEMVAHGMIFIQNIVDNMILLILLLQLTAVLVKMLYLTQCTHRQLSSVVSTPEMLLMTLVHGISQKTKFIVVLLTLIYLLQTETVLSVEVAFVLMGVELQLIQVVILANGIMTTKNYVATMMTETSMQTSCVVHVKMR